MLAQGNSWLDQVSFWEAHLWVLARILASQSLQGRDEQPRLSGDRDMYRKAWLATQDHDDLMTNQCWLDALHLVQLHLHLESKRKKLSVYFTWGRRECYMVISLFIWSVFLHPFPGFHFRFLLCAGWNGPLVQPNVVVDNNSALSAYL